VFTYSPARGASSPDIHISPPSGFIGDSVTVTISSPAPGASIYYRDTGGVWLSYSGPLGYSNLPSFAVVDIQAYASLSGAKSPVRTATYTFDTNSITPPVSGGDADGNLLYDPWEDFFNLHFGNADADGDGYSNREEMFAGTDPQDDESHPVAVPADVSDPEMSISRAGVSNLFYLRWLWPTQYQSDVIFAIQAADKPTTIYRIPSLSISAAGGTNSATAAATNAIEVFRLRPSLP
jgi:hypothetical protein